MRYAKPRKLTTKRGTLKATLNAWCLSCHQPMAKHGKNFTCSECHLATRIHITNGLGSRAQSIRKGRAESANSQSLYPYCRECRLRMHRVSRNATAQCHAFRCRQCKAIAASHIERSKNYFRDQEILQMLRAGHLDTQIIRKVKCHHTTVRKLRTQVSDARLCECGQLFFHTSKCHRRPGWQSKVSERRQGFDELLVRINRRVPSVFPEEMREEICQEMLLEISRSIDRILANAPDFIKKYKRRYPLQYHSFDANPKLMERIAG